MAASKVPEWGELMRGEWHSVVVAHLLRDGGKGGGQGVRSCFVHWECRMSEATARSLLQAQLSISLGVHELDGRQV